MLKEQYASTVLIKKLSLLNKLLNKRYDIGVNKGGYVAISELHYSGLLSKGSGLDDTMKEFLLVATLLCCNEY